MGFEQKLTSYSALITRLSTLEVELGSPYVYFLVSEYIAIERQIITSGRQILIFDKQTVTLTIAINSGTEEGTSRFYSPSFHDGSCRESHSCSLLMV